MTNDSIGYRNQKFDGGTGGLNYQDENFPGGNRDTSPGEKKQRIATPLGMTELGGNWPEEEGGDREDASEDQPNNPHNHNLVAVGVVVGAVVEKVGDNCGDMQD